MPLYAAVKNPYVASIALKDRLKNASQAQIDAFTQGLVAQGHDGVILENEDGNVELVAFQPAQVKSVTGNTGAYGQRPITAQEAEGMGLTEAQANQAQADGDIRFSRARAIGDTLKAVTVTDLKVRAGNKLADYRSLGLQFLGGRQLTELYGQDLPPLLDYQHGQDSISRLVRTGSALLRDQLGTAAAVNKSAVNRLVNTPTPVSRQPLSAAPIADAAGQKN